MRKGSWRKRRLRGISIGDMGNRKKGNVKYEAPRPSRQDGTGTWGFPVMYYHLYCAPRTRLQGGGYGALTGQSSKSKYIKTVSKINIGHCCLWISFELWHLDFGIRNMFLIWFRFQELFYFSLNLIPYPSKDRHSLINRINCDRRILSGSSKDQWTLFPEPGKAGQDLATRSQTVMT